MSQSADPDKNKKDDKKLLLNDEEMKLDSARKLSGDLDDEIKILDQFLLNQKQQNQQSADDQAESHISQNRDTVCNVEVPLLGGIFSARPGSNRFNHLQSNNLTDTFGDH